MSPEEALRLIPARSVGTLLSALHGLRQRANAGEAITLPCLRLHLRSGGTLSGWLLDLAQERNEWVLLLQAGDCTDSTPPTDAAYLNVRDIEAITVCDAGRFAHVLSFGAVEFPPGVDPPTLMTLRRRAEDIGRTVGMVLSLDVEPDRDTERFRLGAWLESLGVVLRGFAATEVGRAALDGRLLRLRAGSPAAVTLEGDTLLLTIDLTTRPDNAVLRDLLSAQL